jgi:hypothetical protein
MPPGTAERESRLRIIVRPPPKHYRGGRATDDKQPRSAAVYVLAAFQTMLASVLAALHGEAE